METVNLFFKPYKHPNFPNRLPKVQKKNKKKLQAAYSYLFCRSVFKSTSKTVSAVASITPTDFARTPLPFYK
jgi:hypothetical protein